MLLRCMPNGLLNKLRTHKSNLTCAPHSFHQFYKWEIRANHNGRRYQFSKLIKYEDCYNKHRQIASFGSNSQPKISRRIFIAPNGTVCGDVEIQDYVSIWYNVVIRSDVGSIRIGSTTNIQDNTVITEVHGSIGLRHDGSTTIGHFVTVGHDCHLSACTIEECCLVGMHSTVCPDSYIEKHSMLAANSLLDRGARIRSKELWAGRPAKFIRFLTSEEIEGITEGSKRYWQVAMNAKNNLIY